MIRLIIAIIFSWIIVGYFIKDIEKNYFELALGTQTSEYYAKGDNNELIHSGGLNTFEQLYIDWSKRGKNDIILLLGNSQYHGINQMKAGDINLSQILYDYFKNNSDFNVNQDLQDLFRKSFLKFFKVPKSDVRYERNGIYTYYDLEINGVSMARFFLLDTR